MTTDYKLVFNHDSRIQFDNFLLFKINFKI